MLVQLLDLKKIIILSILAAITAAVFLFNIYVLPAIILAVFVSLRFGIRNVVIVFTIITYFLVTSDLNEELRSIINIFNLGLLAFIFIYYEGINIETLETLPRGFKLFIVTVFISFLFSSIQSDFFTISIAAFIRQVLFFLICFIYYSFLKAKQDYYLVIYTIVLISVILGIGIMYQLFTKGIGVYYLESMDAIRFSGLYNNPNAVGLFLVIALPLLFSFFFNGKISDSTAKKLVFSGLSLFMLFCLIITNSRASIIAVLISLAYMLYIFKRKLLVKILSGILAVCLIVFLFPFVQEYFLFYIRADRVFSNTRTYFWSIAFDIITNNPVFGVGPGVFEEYIYKYLPVSLGSFFEHQMDMARSGTAHNFFLFRTADLGLLGLITSIWLFVIFFRYAKTAAQYFKTRDPEYFIILTTIQSIGIGLLIRAFFESTGIMTHGWITRDLPFWLMFIIMLFMYQKTTKAESKDER